jgi:hypothetical protein
MHDSFTAQQMSVQCPNLLMVYPMNRQNREGINGRRASLALSFLLSTAIHHFHARCPETLVCALYRAMFKQTRLRRLFHWESLLIDSIQKMKDQTERRLLGISTIQQIATQCNAFIQTRETNQQGGLNCGIGCQNLHHLNGFTVWAVCDTHDETVRRDHLHICLIEV